jgi:hypothetical protein
MATAKKLAAEFLANSVKRYNRSALNLWLRPPASPALPLLVTH